MEAKERLADIGNGIGAVQCIKRMAAEGYVSMQVYAALSFTNQTQPPGVLTDASYVFISLFPTDEAGNVVFNGLHCRKRVCRLGCSTTVVLQGLDPRICARRLPAGAILGLRASTYRRMEPETRNYEREIAEH